MRRYAAIASRDATTTPAAAVRLIATISAAELPAVYGSTVGVVAPLPGVTEAAGVTLGDGDTDGDGLATAAQAAEALTLESFVLITAPVDASPRVPLPFTTAVPDVPFWKLIVATLTLFTQLITTF